MASNDKLTSNSQSSDATSEASAGGIEHRDAVALGFTAAILAFVGAVVVLTIPYAFFSAPLPPRVDRLGLSGEVVQGLLFGRVWLPLIPSALFALWVGYKSYRWGCRAVLPPADEAPADITDH